MNWPDYFVTDCPPDDAQDADHSVLRLVDNDPPRSSDFLPHIVAFPKRNFVGKECDACGLSVYTATEDVQRLQKRIPALRNKARALGHIVAEDGVILPTPSWENSHHTWWVPEGKSVHQKFEVVGAYEEE